MASSTDKILRITNGSTPVSTTLSAGKVVGAPSISCSALVGWDTTQAVPVIIYKVGADGKKTAGTQTEWIGTVSGTTISNLVLTYGTDQIYNSGDVVASAATGAWAYRLGDALLSEHSTSGTHGNITATGLSIPSGAVTLPAGSLETADYANASVTPAKLATGAAAAFVATAETSVQGGYSQLPTTTDNVTVTIGANGLALVSISANMSMSTLNSAIYTSFDVSGATTTAANDNKSVMFTAFTNNVGSNLSGSFLVTGLTAGSTTFGLRYRVSGNTGTWSNRRIGVVPL